MSDYTVVPLGEAPDVLGDYPGEMRFLSDPLGTRQVAVTHRRMPRHTGGKGGYGHRHRTQEEIYFIISGRVQAKLDDEVIEVQGPAAIRVAPEVARSFWNDGAEDVHLLIVSTRSDDPREDVEIVEGFWPD